MKLVLATSNKGKVKEIKALCKEFEVIPYSELMEEFEIIEDGSSFKENALIKARAVFKALNSDDVIVMADDSGISVNVLDGKPGIYSARHAGKDATDKDNLYKLIQDIKDKNVTSSPAYYTAAIAIVTKNSQYCVHGWMYGTAISEAIGDGGFGYDPMFIPLGYDKTLGELDDEVKKSLSHRAKALGLAKIVLQTL
ncbi:MAG: RdgB/HAM1 family non-canonical purine NTP pyrophosphatase [Sulfurimonas sp.]|jgi:XTP/dITP diphosphohydrolase|uniref:RdgB/HAM1 family non-canonical purine NTP pyrophosphatase n=1 Tax=Sulfurimonas sp. TaxID=2022749 RepID=UPI0008C1A6AE|nr:RdgB/HAM1 family non-canonical purine NTP pyrophosphatase [Sulfurimonas sp.]MBS4067145.1 RdgB/HAM1 family non-canonical purine NTP pyrophosphatase [Sulfurimonas sp.]MDD3854659.1 RdgB/HAM1 family non-canonical purine NTP pyrophosphatase [Sulfurimonas sp.]OHE11223.1 MAG: non-canonical purine NTP pyrophosphatase, RdgB/HAM1 family [Sulfurimonas sp. RIFOXYC2_FULL_36_7]